MLYLEDYLELIEHLPQEIRQCLTNIRESDLAVDTKEHILERRTERFFSDCSKYGDQIPTHLKQEYESLQNAYKTFLNDSNEKIKIANHMYEIVDKYLKRLESELFKFKLELEADNKGITEQLEKRSLQLDESAPSSPASSSSFNKSHFPSSSLNSSLSSAQGNPSHFVQQQQQQQHQQQTQQQQQQQLKDKENRQKRLDRRKESDRHSSSLAGYNSLTMNTSNSSTSMTSNIPQMVPSSSISYNLGQTGAGTAIAVAASQAIAATQQLQQGRRTASLKASYEAINNSSRELSIAKELQGAAHTALQAIHHDQMSNKRNKKKWMSNFSSFSQQQLTTSSSPPPGSSAADRLSPNATISSAQMQSSSGYQTGESSRHYTDSYGASTTAASGAVAATSETITSQANNDEGLEQEFSYDPNEPRYCICNQVSYGDMVACDNTDCPYEWFHYPCVNITAPPKGKWYCPPCSGTMRKKSRRN